MIHSDLMARLEILAQSKNTDINTFIQECVDRYESNDTIIDITLDAVISTNASYQIIAFNHGAENTFGYKTEEILGQPLGMLIPQPLIEIHHQHMQEFAKGNEPTRLTTQRGTVSGKHQDGTIFSAEVSISKSGRGKDSQFHVVLRDISERIAIQQRLEESEQYLRLIMDNISDIVCLHEPDGRYNFISLSSYKLTGYYPDELIGKQPDDYIHPDDIKVLQNLNKIVRAGESFDGALYRFRHKGGHYIWLETKAHPVIDDNNTVTHLVTGTREVTEQIRVHRELQQERDLLAKIMNTSPSGISVVDKNGALEFGNKRSEEILRSNNGGQLGRTYDSSGWKHRHFDGSPWPDENQPFIRVMKTGKPVYNVQHAIESPDGQRVLLSINGAPLFDESGEISKVIFTIEDVTELVRAEESLRELLTREREVNTLKSRFLSIISHEFRTPLSVILTSTDILEFHTNGKLTSKELRYLEQIRTQVKYLDIQLDEVSVLNRSNQINQELNLEQTFVVDLLNQLITETQERYENSPPIQVITPHTKTDTFLIDPQLIQHIFTNLISNAVKYSNGEGVVTITLTCTDKTFYFNVKDQGIGIREEDQSNLFDFFFRGENVGGVKGTGIGLAIVKQSVKAHGGQIEFMSQHGVGSTFKVTIPIQS
jgi:PAS domain S-box-containing protein